ncbi:UNVERIFIED_CONTAM: hypothetical protein Sradi_4010100 [Sesamum radiatum]|uniref:Uncharacterized protein n=1 Tax=Sesamum radiatum TaxID=300843 RepID=A0AAW2PKL0_SESRA
MLSNFITAANTRFQNQDASIRNLEVQIRQLVSMVSSRKEGQLPSDTEKNQGSKSMQSLKSGKIIGDDHPKEQVEEAQAQKEEEPQGKIRGSPPKLNLDAIPPYIPYPSRIVKANLDKQFRNFLEIFKKIHINIPLIDALSQMPSYAKFWKEVISNKRKWEGGETVKLNEECSAVLQNKLLPKLKDPGSFSIPCTIGNTNFDKALCDLGASVNLMPYSIFEKLGMHELTPTIITLQLADRSIKYPRGIVEDVLVKVGKFIIPVDFIVLDMEEDVNMPLILGRPFLATSRALIDVQKGQLTLRVNDEHLVFNVFKPTKYLHKNEHDICAINSINSSNGNNLQGVKEEHKEATNFVDTGHGPNRKKRWRNQAYENGGLYKEHTKARDVFHMKKKSSRMVTSDIIRTRALLKWIGKGSNTTLREHFHLLWSTPSCSHILEAPIVKLTTLKKRSMGGNPCSLQFLSLFYFLFFSIVHDSRVTWQMESTGLSHDAASAQPQLHFSSPIHSGKFPTPLFLLLSLGTCSVMHIEAAFVDLGVVKVIRAFRT